MDAEDKLCPLAAAANPHETGVCLGERCACYIKTSKPRPIKAGEWEYADPDNFYRYAGCGLVSLVHWELVKREEKQPK